MRAKRPRRTRSVGPTIAADACRTGALQGASSQDRDQADGQRPLDDARFEKCIIEYQADGADVITLDPSCSALRSRRVAASRELHSKLPTPT
jgi:hypothetical protein